ncbi:MAG TPA: hypothetical protein VMJ32_09885 [Pirellulales bacterium]|nr:hypothetical protein [Pirellulales bacterium]
MTSFNKYLRNTVSILATASMLMPSSVWAKGPSSVSHVSAIHSSSGSLSTSGNTLGKISTSEVPVPKRSPHQDPFHLSKSFNESEHVNLSQLGPKLPGQVLSQFNSPQTLHITAQPTGSDNVHGGNKEPERISSLLEHSETVTNQTRSSQFASTKTDIKNINGDHTELTDAQTGLGGEGPAGTGLLSPLERALYASPRTLDSQFAPTKTGIKNISGDHTELTDEQQNPPLTSRPDPFLNRSIYHLDPMNIAVPLSSLPPGGSVPHIK